MVKQTKQSIEDKEWDENCKQCIWHNDETGKCEGSVDYMGFFELSPFFKAHPELERSFPLGGGDDECINMEHRPDQLKEASAALERE